MTVKIKTNIISIYYVCSVQKCYSKFLLCQFFILTDIISILIFLTLLLSKNFNPNSSACRFFLHIAALRFFFLPHCGFCVLLPHCGSMASAFLLHQGFHISSSTRRIPRFFFHIMVPAFLLSHYDFCVLSFFFHTTMLKLLLPPYGNPSACLIQSDAFLISFETCFVLNFEFPIFFSFFLIPKYLFSFAQ